MKKINKDPSKYLLEDVTKSENNSEIAVIANDFHYPFQDNRVIKLWLSFLVDINPAHIIINGDLMDCFALSKFDKDPRRMVRFKRELELGHEFFAKLRELFPKAHIVFVYGNHEFRLQSFIVRQAQEIADLDVLALESLLGLDKLDIEIANSGLKESFYKFGDLYVSHFNKVSQHGGYTAKLLVDQKGVSILQGHTHRMGSSIRSYLDGRVLGGWDNGCMCNLHPSYVLDPNWCHGFSVVWKEKDSGRFTVAQIPIIKYKFRFGKTLYKG